VWECGQACILNEDCFSFNYNEGMQMFELSERLPCDVEPVVGSPDAPGYDFYAMELEK